MTYRRRYRLNNDHGRWVVRDHGEPPGSVAPVEVASARTTPDVLAEKVMAQLSDELEQRRTDDKT